MFFSKVFKGFFFCFLLSRFRCISLGADLSSQDKTPDQYPEDTDSQLSPSKAASFYSYNETSIASNLLRPIEKLLPWFSGEQNIRTTEGDHVSTPPTDLASPSSKKSLISLEALQKLVLGWVRKWYMIPSKDDAAANKVTGRLYDFIIVGGGTVGCPLARTLADSGKEILLIERGGPRKDHPDTLDIYGAGIVIGNKDVSQPIITSDGVISHVASVLSGGSAINMAIIIEESDEYFDYLESFPGVSFDRAKLRDAFNWTMSWLVHPVPESVEYGDRWKLGLEKVYGPYLQSRSQLSINNSWTGFTSFDPENNWFRVGADVALGQLGVDFPKSLHVLLNHNVHKIEFEMDPATGNHRATCVRFSHTTLDDVAPIGRKKPLFWGFPLNIFRFFTYKNHPKFSAFLPSKSLYRACVKPGGEIISSAGTSVTMAPEGFYSTAFHPQVIRDCADGKVPLNNPLLSGLCLLVQPLVDCFRRVAANFYFTAEPKSIAQLEISSEGDLIVTGNYLKDPQDLQDAMRGVANIIKIVNSRVYDGIFQPAGINSCPMKILNGLVSLVDNEAMRFQNIEGVHSGKNSGNQNEIDHVKEFLENTVEEYRTEFVKAEELRKRGSLSEAMNESNVEDNEKELEGNWLNLFDISSTTVSRHWTSQRYATYPPLIPDPTDNEGLMKFAKTFMTSIWHWVGSAQMGVVVDDRFLVKGFNNLRVVDASILNQVTRMNPFFTLISIGRYAGLVINEDWTPPSSSS